MMRKTIEMNTSHQNNVKRGCRNDPTDPRGRRRRAGFGAAAGTSLAATVVIVVAAAWVGVGSGTGRAEIPEPETLVYGKVLNHSGGQEYQLHEGLLSWTISDPSNSGVSMVLFTELEPLRDGVYSYQLKIPHAAASFGLDSVAGTLPLGDSPAILESLEIQVDGFPARILRGDPIIRVSQNQRAAAHRIDLEVFFQLPDSDGDGMPDWWEDRHNLNKLFPGDAFTDADGDGSNNLKEFEDGTDPAEENTRPVLVADSLLAYPGGRTVVSLRTNDSDSSPDQLVYTLDAVTGDIGLERIGPDGDIQELAAASTFTQSEVDAGIIVVGHRVGGGTGSGLGITLLVQDENPDHAADRATLPVRLYEPATATARVDASAGVYDGEWIGAHPSATEQAPSGKNAYAVDGHQLILEGLTGAGADRTVFTVFRADGTVRQQLVNDIDFELTVEGDSGKIRFADSETSMFSNHSTGTGWALVGLLQRDSSAALLMDGLHSGALFGIADSANLATRAGVGGKSMGTFDRTSQAWIYESVDSLTGALGETLIYDSALSDADQRGVSRYLLSKWFGVVVVDASGDGRARKVNASGSSVAYSFLGGAGNDEFIGGSARDFLQGGPGADTLAGNGGGDVFVFGGGDDGEDAILDFDPAGGDILDLSAVLSGTSFDLDDYVQVTSSGTNTKVAIDADGDGSGFSDLVFHLRNNVFRQADVQDWWVDGNLNTGNIRILPNDETGPTRINVVAMQPMAREEGAVPGQIALSRTGFPDAPLTINIQIGGSALNGVDYSFIGGQVRFEAGEKEAMVSVTPFADSADEPMEVVQIVVASGDGYEIGEYPSAIVQIADLPERISIEALETLAVQETGASGLLLVTRTGNINRSTTVRLSLAGSGVNGVHYRQIPPFLSFAPGQNTASLSVTPAVSADLASGPRSVVVTILPDPLSAYSVGDASAGVIHLVAENVSLDSWTAKHFDSAGAGDGFAPLGDSDGDGIRNLDEYAYGLDPNVANGPGERGGFPRASVDDGHLTVVFRQLIQATDVAYQVAVSSDLGEWVSGPDVLEQVPAPGFAGDSGMTAYRVRAGLTESPFRFIRVKVSTQ